MFVTVIVQCRRLCVSVSVCLSRSIFRVHCHSQQLASLKRGRGWYSIWSWCFLGGYPMVGRSSRRIDKREGVEYSWLGRPADSRSDSLDPSRLLSGAGVTGHPPHHQSTTVTGFRGHDCWCNAAYHAGTGSRMDSSPVATNGKGACNFSGPLSDPIIVTIIHYDGSQTQCYRGRTKKKKLWDYRIKPLWSC
jgi:hypothetical protein